MDLSLKRGFRETLAATWYKVSLEVSGYMEKILKESSCDSTSKTFMANGCILPSPTVLRRTLREVWLGSTMYD